MAADVACDLDSEVSEQGFVSAEEAFGDGVESEVPEHGFVSAEEAFGDEVLRHGAAAGRVGCSPSPGGSTGCCGAGCLAQAALAARARGRSEEATPLA